MSLMTKAAGLVLGCSLLAAAGSARIESSGGARIESSGSGGAVRAYTGQHGTNRCEGCHGNRQIEVSGTHGGPGSHSGNREGTIIGNGGRSMRLVGEFDAADFQLAVTTVLDVVRWSMWTIYGDRDYEPGGMGERRVPRAALDLRPAARR